MWRIQFFSQSRKGSPPHTWRILAPQCIPLSAVRITSTLVENTILIVKKWYLNRDHLHTRGEYLLVLLSNHLYLGSPPHSWRILQPLSISSKIDRITSTLVENTFSFAEHNLLGEDHLHTRGEYSHLQLRQLNQSGSPPHSWRIPTMHSSSLIPYRITSTLVENTLNDPRYINISQSK